MWSDRIFSGKNYIRGKQILIIKFRSSLRTVGLIGRQAGRQAVNYKLKIHPLVLITMFCSFCLNRLRSLASTSNKEQRSNERINVNITHRLSRK